MPQHYTDPDKKTKKNFAGRQPLSYQGAVPPQDLLNGLEFFEVPLGADTDSVFQATQNPKFPLDTYEIIQNFQQQDSLGEFTGGGGYTYRPIDILQEIAADTIPPPGSNIRNIGFTGGDTATERSRSRGDASRVGLRNGRNISRRKLANRAFRERN